jgi:ATP-binding cassette subfamily C (CFTR/MRP) protein 4
VISIVPQNPVLFSGTLRKNLDPLNEYSDVDIWNALEQVEPKDAIVELPSDLETSVSEEGSIFIVGQKQLLCLLRAILKDSKIIILDETMANIDFRSDDLIQAPVRWRFKNCTIITIAHRLLTVMDSDEILVMDSGQIVEFDHPYNLLQNSNVFFYK